MTLKLLRAPRFSAAIRFKICTWVSVNEIHGMEVALNKLVLRIALSFVVVASWGVSLFPSATFAQENRSVSLHAAPPDFFRFLYKHDSNGSIFASNGNWVPGGEADVIVSFSKNENDKIYVPAILLSTFERVIPMDKAHIYHIPQKVFGDSLSSDVIFVLENNVFERLEGYDVRVPNEPQIGPFYSCFTAGIVERVYLSLGEKRNDKEIAELCLQWLDGTS